MDDNTFNWTLDLSSDLHSEQEKLTPSQIALQLYRDRQNADKLGKSGIDTVLSKHITDPQPLLTFTITAEDAKEYCNSIGMRFFGKKWHDKTVIVSI